jgi:hypothetical protein
LGSLIVWSFHIEFFSVIDFGLNLLYLTLLFDIFVYFGEFDQLFFNHNVGCVTFEGTCLVELEIFWSKHIRNHRSIPKQLLLDLLGFLVLTEAATQEVAGFDLGRGCTILISGARNLLVSKIWSAILGNQIAILS